MVERMILEGRGYDVCSYFYVDEDGAGFLFDPGADPDKIMRRMRAGGYSVEKIIITHGHFDHIGALDDIRALTGAPVLIHENGKLFLSDPRYNLSAGISTHADGYFKDGDLIKTRSGSLCLRVIHTPGHTDDSCVFYSEKDGIAFTGDTIFKETFGNYMFPTGNYGTLMDSIKNRILTLPADTVLYSGHTSETTVGDESGMYL